MWISWKILFTSLQLHLYFKCQSNPGFFPIYPPIILKSCSAVTRGEIEVLSLTWGSLLTLNNKTGTEYAVWFCSVIIISPLKQHWDPRPRHTHPVPVLMHTGQRGVMAEQRSLLAGRSKLQGRWQVPALCPLRTEELNSTFCPGQSTGAQPTY